MPVSDDRPLVKSQGYWKNSLGQVYIAFLQAHMKRKCSSEKWCQGTIMASRFILGGLLLEKKGLSVHEVIMSQDGLLSWEDCIDVFIFDIVDNCDVCFWQWYPLPVDYMQHWRFSQVTCLENAAVDTRPFPHVDVSSCSRTFHVHVRMEFMFSDSPKCVDFSFRTYVKFSFRVIVCILFISECLFVILLCW